MTTLKEKRWRKGRKTSCLGLLKRQRKFSTVCPLSFPLIIMCEARRVRHPQLVPGPLPAPSPLLSPPLVNHNLKFSRNKKSLFIYERK